MPEGNNSREYYRSSSGYSRRDDRSPSLPSIHEVLEDVLAQPAWPTPRGYVPQAPYPSLHQATPPGYHGDESTTEYLLPPIRKPGTFTHRRSHTVQRSPSDQRNTYSPRRDTEHPQAPGNRDYRAQSLNVQQSSHSYDLYESSPTQGLVHQRTSTVHHFPQRATRSDAEDPSRRHVCDECGARFDRPNSLETHRRTHTGERPFRCGYPGCNKSFTVRSNMRRHERTHEAPSAFASVEADRDGDNRRYSSGPSTGHPSRGGSPSGTSRSSSTSKPSSKYYSSSRR